MKWLDQSVDTLVLPHWTGNTTPHDMTQSLQLDISLHLWSTELFTTTMTFVELRNAKLCSGFYVIAG